MPVHKEISTFSTVYNVILLISKVALLYATALLGFNKHEGCKGSHNGERVSFKDKIIDAKDFNEIVSVSGYRAREHVVTTRDGYLLVVHKLEKANHTDATADCPKTVVYMHHGLLTNSDLWVLGSTKEKILPYLLVDAGYDVYLGNNRGNKYSRKHLKLSASDPQFWDFSLDEFSYYDIPDTIEYIQNLYKYKRQSGMSRLNGTSSERILNSDETGSLTPVSFSNSTSTLANYQVTDTVDIIYIGFSQGCSQLLASLSLYPELNSKIKAFIGLSPAIIPSNLNHPIFKLIVNQTAADNSFLYSIFGRRAIMPSVSFWSTAFGARLYEKVVDKSLSLLFGWSGQNISEDQKQLGYPHMFSNSSVKSLLHWFQIIKAGRFQMFDETCSCGLTKLSSVSAKAKEKGNRVTPFPITDHLNVPMYLFYGDSDILVDIGKTKSLIVDSNPQMKDKLNVELCDNYEHMDTLWGDNVYEDVFCKILTELDKMDQCDKFERVM
ncbi:hypothetical protein CANMA_000021 [Candida margitis]|uniref:uncharacterized protein n=1 Tax=Candida margitis TaxID=1775924 RepID=UPI002227D75F|nr:uncharacterized protein CANMA_000021 [Candida margitis]KAI5970861.1 hypothetical protein CANMA_000021 [Candida margitis]